MTESVYWEMPVQVPASSPLSSYIRPCPPQPAKQGTNHSISKWAYTELSTQEHKQQEQATLWQQLLAQPDHPPACIIHSEQNMQSMGEATFKPLQLRKHLQPDNKENTVKQLLKKTLRQESSRKGHEDSQKRAGKTRYQKILDDYYHKSRPQDKLKENKENIHRQNRVNHNSITELPPRIKKNSKPHHNYQSKLNIPPQRSYSHKQLPSAAIDSIKTLCQPLPRTLSQLTFLDRQKITIERQREKVREGKEAKYKKEVEECTFKPRMRAADWQRPTKQVGAGSYAKLYRQKIRSRRI